MPKNHVEKSGVRCCGWILANRRGAAFAAPIESMVRADGKIVV